MLQALPANRCKRPPRSRRQGRGIGEPPKHGAQESLAQGCSTAPHMSNSSSRVAHKSGRAQVRCHHDAGDLRVAERDRRHLLPGQLHARGGGVDPDAFVCLTNGKDLAGERQTRWHVQFIHPYSAHVPHDSITRFFSASRARNTRTPALFAERPFCSANVFTGVPATSTT